MVEGRAAATAAGGNAVTANVVMWGRGNATALVVGERRLEPIERCMLVINLSMEE